MKTKSVKYAIIYIILCLPAMSWAAVKDDQQWFYNALLYTMLGLAFILLLIVFYLFQLVATLDKQFGRTAETEERERAYNARTFWEKVWGLNPKSFEKKLTLEHNYDGIYELDNPTPPWFNFLFYGTIFFGVVYMLYYHVITDGNIQETEYKKEVLAAEQLQAEIMKKTANAINEDNVRILTDSKAIAEGKSLYDKNCVACHLQDGGGSVGPNLTDAYWIHGNSPKEIFHTISEGVLEKGMISWKKQLNPAQIQNLMSYLITLQGTTPKEAKAPQGEKIGYTLGKTPENSDSGESRTPAKDSTKQEKSSI